jgi:hypothetical protein
VFHLGADIVRGTAPETVLIIGIVAFQKWRGNLALTTDMRVRLVLLLRWVGLAAVATGLVLMATASL